MVNHKRKTPKVVLPAPPPAPAPPPPTSSLPLEDVCGEAVREVVCEKAAHSDRALVNPTMFRGADAPSMTLQCLQKIYRRSAHPPHAEIAAAELKRAAAHPLHRPGAAPKRRDGAERRLLRHHEGFEISAASVKSVKERQMRASEGLRASGASGEVASSKRHLESACCCSRRPQPASSIAGSLRFESREAFRALHCSRSIHRRGCVVGWGLVGRRPVGSWGNPPARDSVA